LLATGALALGVLGTAIPAQASVAPTTSVVATSSVATASVARAAVTPTTVPRAVLVARRAAVVRAAYAAHVLRVRVTAVKVAKSRLGSRYVAGSAGPRRFDCSGLALYVVKHSTGRSLPHYSKAQYRVTKRVAKKNLRPGDLVFFFRHGAHHVGVYIGHGRMISATNPRSGVKVDLVFSGWYGSRYSGAGRLI
jgi:cell wall-associated NlpC family hydrolase